MFSGLLLQSVLDNLTPFNVLMHVGIGASSFLTLSQLGAARFGIMQLINSPAHRQSLGLTTRGAVSAWNVFFSKAAAPVVASVVLSTASYLGAAYYLPTASSSPSRTSSAELTEATRKFLYLTAFVSLLPLPFTLLRLAPNIRALQSLLPKASLTSAEEAFAWKHINSWYAGHHIRVGIYATSLLMGMFAYNAAPRV